jgi:hypothetical protein
MVSHHGAEVHPLQQDAPFEDSLGNQLSALFHPK